MTKIEQQKIRYQELHPIIEVECRSCKVLFTRKNSKRLYCSDKCRQMHYKNRGTNKTTLNKHRRDARSIIETALSEKECPKCKILFKQKVHSQRYCCPNHQRLDALNRWTKPYRAFKDCKCVVCGFIPVDKCQLDVDHIDGDRQNSDPNNLQTLCANCHRLKTKINKEGVYSQKRWPSRLLSHD